MFKFLTVIGVIIHLALSLFSQKNLHPGIIVNAVGDSIPGQIDLHSWDQNPDRIYFSESADEKSGRWYDVSELKAFTIEGMGSYRRFITSISMDETDPANVREGVYMQPVVDTVLLKELVNGKVAILYSCADQCKDKVFYFKRLNG